MLFGVIGSGMGSACASLGVRGVSASRGGDESDLEGSLQMRTRRLVCTEVLVCTDVQAQ